MTRRLLALCWVLCGSLAGCDDLFGPSSTANLTLFRVPGAVPGDGAVVIAESASASSAQPRCVRLTAAVGVLRSGDAAEASAAAGRVAYQTLSTSYPYRAIFIYQQPRAEAGAAARPDVVTADLFKSESCKPGSQEEVVARSVLAIDLSASAGQAAQDLGDLQTTAADGGRD